MLQKKRTLIHAAGILGLVGAFLPIRVHDPPQAVTVSAGSAPYLQLLLLQGVGEKTASEIRRQRILQQVGVFEGLVQENRSESVE